MIWILYLVYLFYDIIVITKLINIINKYKI